MSYFPKTRAAVGYAASQGRSILVRGRAEVLIRRLQACEAALDEVLSRVLWARFAPRATSGDASRQQA